MGLFRGDNGGAEWHDLKIGKHAAHLRYGRDVVVAPWDPMTLFACVADSSRGEAGRLYRSQDLGQNWSQFDHSIDVQSTMMAVAVHDRGSGALCHKPRPDVQHVGWWRKLAGVSHFPEGAGAAVAVACG